MCLKRIDVTPYHPIWRTITKIIKNERLKYDKDKPVVDITFGFNNKNYKARITNYDEECSSFDVYCECGNPNHVSAAPVTPKVEPEESPAADSK